ncbi:MAG: hypothetical protein FWG91_05710 [Lachnospiraceae bacterium]|nr:hypothetical protein [Lachnospiraceae bacterium]
MYFSKISNYEYHLHIFKPDLDIRGLTLQDLLYDKYKCASFIDEIDEMFYLSYGLDISSTSVDFLKFSDYSKDFVTLSLKLRNRINEKSKGSG